MQLTVYMCDSVLVRGCKVGVYNDGRCSFQSNMQIQRRNTACHDCCCCCRGAPPLAVVAVPAATAMLSLSLLLPQLLTMLPTLLPDMFRCSSP